MNWLVFGVMIIAVSFAVLVIAVVQAAGQLKSTLAAAEKLLLSVEGSIKPFIEEDIKGVCNAVNSALSEVEGAAREAKEGIGKVNGTLDAVKEVGQTVSSINGLIRDNVKGPLISLAASLVGFRTGLATLIQYVMSTKQKEVQ